MRVGARVRLGAVLVLGSIVLAACTDPLPPSPAPSPAPSPTDTPAAPSSAVPAPSSASPTLAPASAGPVDLDPSLLAILPATVDGVAITAEPDAYAEAARDPSFVANVDRAAFAIAVSGSDLASGVVAHLRPGVWSDRFFQDWRDTYDQGACGQAGGVVGHAQSTVGTRSVYVTTCGGGLRVYHAYLPGPGVVVSLFSLGDRHFGDLIMTGLRG